MKLKILLIVTIIWGLVGCAASNVSKDFSLSSNSQFGLLVGSLKYRGTLSGYKVYYKGLSNDEKGFFEVGKGMMLIPIPPKSDFPNQKGKLQVTELPPGEYEITRWGVSSGVAEVSHAQPFRIKFKIEPGKATYIGSFVFTVTNQMGLTVTGAKVDFIDAFEEDSEVLRRLYPKLAMTDFYRGLEPGLKQESIGGDSSVYFNMPIVLNPVIY